MTHLGENLFNNFAKKFQSHGKSVTDLSDDNFSALAIEVFAHQFRHNATYRKFCQYLGTNLEAVSSWQEIPALPTDAFKLLGHPVRTQKSASYFLSSGTTSETRGKHEFPELETYRQSILSGWRDAALPVNFKFLFLAQEPQQTPHSSLAHMMGVLAQEFGTGTEIKSPFLIDETKQFVLHELHVAINRGEPILLFGTALALLNLMEEQTQTWELPKGSIIVETGGYKGSGRNLEKPAFYEQLTRHFAVPAEQIWNEYSMTELSSQAYTSSLDSPHRTPPWMKIKIIDIETRQQVQPGELGFLVIHDLANIHSCAAIETQDLAIFHDHHQFSLIGRDPEALPRGCSRAIDHFLNS